MLPVCFVDVLFYPVGRGTFTPTSMDFLGGTDTRFGGFYGDDFKTGGQTPDVGMYLNGTSGHIVFDSSWQDISVIDWCDYCVEYGYNGGIITNLTFNLSSGPGTGATPEPGTGSLFGAGVLLLVLAAGRRPARRRSREFTEDF